MQRVGRRGGSGLKVRWSTGLGKSKGREGEAGERMNCGWGGGGGGQAAGKRGPPPSKLLLAGTRALFCDRGARARLRRCPGGPHGGGALRLRSFQGATGAHTPGGGKSQRPHVPGSGHGVLGPGGLTFLAGPDSGHGRHLTLQLGQHHVVCRGGERRGGRGTMGGGWEGRVGRWRGMTGGEASRNSKPALTEVGGEAGALHTHAQGPSQSAGRLSRCEAWGGDLGVWLYPSCTPAVPQLYQLYPSCTPSGSLHRAHGRIPATFLPSFWLSPAV